MRKIVAIIIGFVAAMTLNAAPAKALGWSQLDNFSKTGHSILVSTTDPYVYAFSIAPNYGTGRASCFRLTEDMHSPWGGKYYAFTTRCFSSSGNTLPLYSGLS